MSSFAGCGRSLRAVRPLAAQSRRAKLLLAAPFFICPMEMQGGLGNQRNHALFRLSRTEKACRSGAL